MEHELHDLVLRTYDIVTSRVSPKEFMSEVAGFFNARTAALFLRTTSEMPDLICYGTNDNSNDEDRFLQSLHSDVSDLALGRMMDAQFSVTMVDSERASHVLIFDNATSDSEHGENQRRMASALLPHIVRSISLAQSTERFLPDSRAAADSISSRLAPPTITLDQDGRITGINAKATSLIQSCNVIRRIHDRIELSTPALAERFSRKLKTLLSDKPAEPFFLRLAADDDENGLILLTKQYPASTPGVVIYLQSMRAGSGFVPSHFSEQYGLTVKELRLASGLMQGNSLQQLALEFYVSVHTLRTQVKSVFRKTGANSQAALIVLMLAESSMEISQ